MRQDFVGLSYPDRWIKQVAEEATLAIFVLKEGATSTIAPHSGIVGRTVVAGTALCHYEGWVHGAAQYADRDARGRWEAGVRHAAGRALTDYPTVARQTIRLDGLVRVGTYHAANDRIEITNETEVQRWLS